MKTMEDWRKVDIAPFKGKVRVNKREYAVRAPENPLQLVRGYREAVPTKDECMIFPYHKLSHRTFTMDNCVANLLICFCVKGEGKYTCVDAQEGIVGTHAVKSKHPHDTVFEFSLENAPHITRGTIIQVVE
jgi:hypothetical protein